tara:strand:+ start:392 stop:823 length:432 start_codon:yes stop_codon:yes gene_type:complete
MRRGIILHNRPEEYGQGRDIRVKLECGNRRNFIVNDDVENFVYEGRMPQYLKGTEVFWEHCEVRPACPWTSVKFDLVGEDNAPLRWRRLYATGRDHTEWLESQTAVVFDDWVEDVEITGLTFKDGNLMVADIVTFYVYDDIPF